MGRRQEETGVIGNSRRGHAKRTMGRGIDDITPCSLPPTGERNSYHNGCSETGQGVEQRLPSSSISSSSSRSSRSRNKSQKSGYHHAGIKLDEIQAMTKENLACPVWNLATVVKTKRRRGERGGGVWW
jgi:hypothetical protein